MSELKIKDRKDATKFFIDNLLEKCHVDSLFDIKEVSFQDLDLLPGSLRDTYSFIIKIKAKEDKTFSALKLKEGKEIDSSIIDISVSDLRDFWAYDPEDCFESFSIELSGNEVIKSIRSTMNIRGKENPKVDIREIFIIR